MSTLGKIVLRACGWLPLKVYRHEFPSSQTKQPGSPGDVGRHGPSLTQDGGNQHRVEMGIMDLDLSAGREPGDLLHLK